MDETGVKANLKVTLMANDLIVAESSDSKLWKTVLSAIAESKNDLSEGGYSKPYGNNMEESHQDSDMVVEWARELEIDISLLKGACHPSLKPPYISLDFAHWEKLKKRRPKKGPKSVSPSVLAATLLALWFRYLKKGNPTQKQALDVLKTISLNDPNASRSIKNCEWLQSRRREGITLHPGEYSRALELAKDYCLKKQPQN